MRVLFDDEVPVQYGFIRLEPPDVDVDLQAAGGQANGLCGAGVPGALFMITGLHTGEVALRIESHDREPLLAADWEDVVEVSLTVVAGDYWLSSFEWSTEINGLAPASYRVRWCASGMDEARTADVRQSHEPVVDRYLMQLWPAPPARDAVVRQGSEIAAYWHQLAHETPPPPPPPTPEEIAAQRAADEREEQAAQEEWEAALETASWGVQAPTDRLRAIGGRTAQLAQLDRDLVELLAALPVERQRAMAVWAARHACAVAGLTGHGWVDEALTALELGEPLPEFWNDWDSLLKLLFSVEDGGVVETRVEVSWASPQGRGTTDPGPVAPEVAAVDAVQEASDENAARAVMGAVDALVSGHRPVQARLADVRARLSHELG